MFLIWTILVGVGCGAEPAPVEQPRPYRGARSVPRSVALDDFDMEARVNAIRGELRLPDVQRATPEEVAAAEAEAEALRAKRLRERQLRRWAWESPAEVRSRLWNVPEEESAEAEATALLRVCMCEADGSELDCLGIWQVLRNIRSRGCTREGFRQRITECDDDGETMLSVMRRAQRFATGMLPPRSRRTQWVAELELDCTRPRSYPGSDASWASQYGRSCPGTAALAQRLIAGDEPPMPFPGVRPITWGGRCEDERGACDDTVACGRGLARVTGVETLNAFWCVPGTQGCAEEMDPLCAQYLRLDPAVPHVTAPDGSQDRLPGEAAEADPVLDQSDPVG
jgi:hypothetical protein